MDLLTATFLLAAVIPVSHGVVVGLRDPGNDSSILPSCPEVDADIPVFYPHPTNCSLFYECSNGVPYLLFCPAGLYFESVNNDCNYPSQVKCNLTDETPQKLTEEPSKPTKLRAKPSKLIKEPLKLTEGLFILTENPTVKEPHFEKDFRLKHIPRCPHVEDIEDVDTVYLPHPSNCSLFYECSGVSHYAVPHLMACPEGLYFDARINVCNYLSQVVCEANSLD